MYQEKGILWCYNSKQQFLQIILDILNYKSNQ